jgi:hypothetical protein
VAISAADFAGIYKVFELGCIPSICCCPSSTLEITRSGNDLSLKSDFSCANSTANAEIGEFSVDLKLNGQLYNLEMASNKFLQAINRKSLSCSFSALKQ